MRRDPRPHRPGFSLVEVLIALAVTGVVLLGARHVIGQMADAARELTRSARILDADATAERLLRALAGRLEVGTSEAREFEGTPTAVQFSSWCEVPAGWLERCEVRVGFDTLGATRRDGGASLSLTLTTTSSTAGVRSATGAAAGERVVLRTGLRGGALRYLDTPDAGGVWFVAWGRGISAPLAFAIVTEASDSAVVSVPVSAARSTDDQASRRTTRPDTMIVRIGARG